MHNSFNLIYNHPKLPKDDNFEWHDNLSLLFLRIKPKFHGKLCMC